MKKNLKNVAVAAGGTGGHIIPAMVIAGELLKKGYKVTFIGTSNVEKYLEMFPDIKRHWNFCLKCVNLSPMPGILRKVIGIPRIMWAIFKVARIVYSRKINLVLGFGGYISLPSILGARLLFRKAVLHEQNSYMGLANRLSLWFCGLGMLGFKKTAGIPFLLKKRVIFTGTPVRDAIKDLSYQNIIPVIDYTAFFKIYDKINIVILGGSQGASAFKDFVPQAICMLSREIKVKLRIFHQCPAQDISQVQQIYNDGLLYADIRPFFYNVPELISTAHILISRSGAGMISEITALGVPSILIPYPYSKNNHQLHNANYLRDNGAAIVIQQNMVTSERLFNLLNLLIDSEDNLSNLNLAAKALSQPESAIKIVALINAMLGIKDDITIENKIDRSRLVTNTVGIS